MTKRRRGRQPRSKHLSLSATDEDWEVVRTAASRRGLSIGRYVLEHVRSDPPDSSVPVLALDADEQRELLEKVRALTDLLQGDVDARKFLADMGRGIDTILDSWALDAARQGRLDEVRALMAARYGEACADEEAARIRTLAASPVRQPQARRRERRTAPESGPKPGTLFE